MPSNESPKNLSKENKLLWKLLNRFGEIYDSKEYIYDAPVLLTHFPFEGTRITKVRYFRYVVENYLREIYSLEQRIKKFAIEVASEYEQIKEKRFDQSNAYKPYQTARNKLNSLIKARNKLVHETRDFDSQLYKLSQLEHQTLFTFKNTEFVQVFASLLESAYEEAVWTRRLQMSQEISELEVIIDEFFMGMNSIILDQNGNLIIP